MKVWAESYVKIPIKFLPREIFNIQGLYKNVCDMIFAKDEAENDYLGKKQRLRILRIVATAHLKVASLEKAALFK